MKVQKEENEDRLVVARNKRRRWLKPDPPMRQLAAPPSNYNGYTNGGSTFSGGRFDPLADVRPPPQIERPGISRVTKPVIEKTRFTSMAASTQAGSAAPSSSALPWTDDQQTLMTDSPTQAEKRKRDEVEDDDGSFRGARDMSMAPPKTTSEFALSFAFFLSFSLYS